MSPRKSRHAVPEHIANSIRKKRKKILYGPYYCPKCRKNEFRVTIDKDNREVIALCNCGFLEKLDYKEIYDPVDYYNKIFDKNRR